MHFSKVAEIYTNSHRLAEETRAHYRFVARQFVKDMGITEIEDLTPQLVEQWRRKVLERNVSATTWNNYFRHFRIMVIFAYRVDIIRKCPITESSYERVYRLPAKTMPTDKMLRIVVYLESEQSKFKPQWFWVAVLRLFFYTGMRRKQLIHLRWSDIDFKEEKLTFQPHSSKTGYSWEIPLTIPTLVSLANVQKETLKVLGSDADLSNRYVFDIGLFNPRYHCRGRMEPNTVTNFFRRLSTETGITISAHRLRHTLATHLAREGQYKELQDILGHRSMQTTMRYIHPKLDTMRALISTIDDIGV